MTSESRIAVAIDEPDTGPRCAVWSREVGLDPIGTAPQTDLFVVVEHPLPWPSDILDDPLLAAVDRAAREAAGPGVSVRLQAVVAESQGTTRHVTVWRASVPFAGYARADSDAEPARLPEVARRLVLDGRPSRRCGVVDEVLVCSHGARDSCCGSMGTRLARAPRAEGVSVLRTSHTGGHRFAPTAITFPDGNYWAYLDSDLLAGIVGRSLPPPLAARHLRGCAAFSPVMQVADRAIFEHRGWEWLSFERIGEQRTERRVELCYRAQDGSSGTYMVAVANGREMPVPPCPVALDGSSKIHTEVRVVSMQHLC